MMPGSETPTPRMGVESGGRERWPGRFSFVMAAIGSAVGLGNIWRFPAVAYANGGGAFFIPYFVALLTAGIPLLILEFTVGQMKQRSAPESLKRLNKHFEWVGWFALFVGAVIATYYAVIMAWSWNYLWYSVAGQPWSAGGEGTEADFFVNRFLQYTTEPGAMWALRWQIVLGLALTWGAVFLVVYKGVHRVGKVVLYTVPIPWAIILILAIRGLMLDGAESGIEYYLRPEWEALKKPGTWLAAYGQVFFSLTIGFGVMIAYASYRPRKSDVTNSAFITSFANCATSFFAGFAVFSVLGFLAFKNGMPVSDVVVKGGGLAFITYPAAITKMGDLGGMWPPLIGALFFFALLTLGIDSLFSLVEAVVAGFRDRFPRMGRTRLTAALCFGGFVVGLLYCTRGGDAWITLFDHWANDYGLAIVGLLQCLLVGYFCNTHEIRDFANEVSEIKLFGWWELCIKVVTPVVLTYLIANQLFEELAGPATSGYPGWMQWTAVAVFVGLFAGALAITRHWSYLALAALALVVGLLTFAVIRPARADPVASVDSARTVEGDPKEVTFSATYAGIKTPVVTRWEFGDGKTSNELEPTHVYKKPGTYEVKLTAHGSGGRGKAVGAGLTVHARPLEIVEAHVARRRGTAAIASPLAYEFAAKADYGSPPHRYEWKLGEGAPVSGPEGEHDYSKPGDYDVTLTVTDAVGWTVEKTFAVKVQPFAVELRADPSGGETPATVDFTAGVFDLDGNVVKGARLEAFDFTWDFGDGQVEKKPGGGNQATHRYDYPAAGRRKWWGGGKEEKERGGEAGPKELPGAQTGPVRQLRATVTVRGRDPDRGGGRLTESVVINLRPPDEHAPWRAALLSGFAAMLLLGGLGLCLHIAYKSGRNGPPELKDEGSDGDERSPWPFPANGEDEAS